MTDPHPHGEWMTAAERLTSWKEPKMTPDRYKELRNRYSERAEKFGLLPSEDYRTMDLMKNPIPIWLWLSKAPTNV